MVVCYLNGILQQNEPDVQTNILDCGHRDLVFRYQLFVVTNSGLPPDSVTR